MKAKKFLVLTMSIVGILALTVPTMAQNMSEDEIREMVAQRNTPEKTYTVKDISYNDAIYEGDTPMTRVAKVTESAAYMVEEENVYCGLEESAEGYVTVKDGNTNVYHYTRAEIYRDGSSYAKSSNLYGYGKVYAKTNYFFVNKNVKSKARVFYGGF